MPKTDHDDKNIFAEVWPELVFSLLVIVTISTLIRVFALKE